MNVIVFTGPTLPAETAQSELAAIYLPPVAEGDVIRAVRGGARVIGIIDGFFDKVPAVRHKEILWAMSRGVHVLGSASMGALRAAELAAFGMEGVGEIFQAFHQGILQDDDEVAVIHGPAESDYRPLSVAMVDIRCTLNAAFRDGTLSSDTRNELEVIAKELPYWKRNYRTLSRLACEHGLPRDELAEFDRWLPSGKVNRKREDALLMLRTLHERLAGRLPSKQPTFVLEYTVYLDQALQNAGTFECPNDHPETLSASRILDELRLKGRAYAMTIRDARLRYLALAEASRCGYTGGSEDIVGQMTATFPRTLGLEEPARLEQWLKENDLSRDELWKLMRDEALQNLVFCLVDTHVERLLPDHLRATGSYAHLKARALDKQSKLTAHGLENPSLEEVGLRIEELLTWYFQRLGQPIPDDLARYANFAGFANSEDLIRVLLREFCYSQVRR